MSFHCNSGKIGCKVSGCFLQKVEAKLLKDEQFERQFLRYQSFGLNMGFAQSVVSIKSEWGL